MVNGKKMVETLARALYDKKGHHPIAVDVKALSSLTDYVLIIEGAALRHVKALSKVAEETLKAHDYPVFHVEGAEEGDWVVVDAGDIVIHILLPELREKYALESLWKKAKLIDLKLES
jgi:ribosome-associated protein